MRALDPPSEFTSEMQHLQGGEGLGRESDLQQDPLLTAFRPFYSNGQKATASISPRFPRFSTFLWILSYKLLQIVNFLSQLLSLFIYFLFKAECVEILIAASQDIA